MKKTLLLFIASLVITNTSAKKNTEEPKAEETISWEWIVRHQPTWDEGLRCYTYQEDPGYMVYPHGNPTCQDCPERAIDEQFKLLSVYNEDFKLIRIVKLTNEWLTSGLNEPIEELRKVALQQEYNPSLKGSISDTTAYAIENMIGLRYDEERTKELSLEYSLKSYAKNDPSMQASMTTAEKQQLEADWTRLNSMDINKLKKEHKSKMKDLKAKQWVEKTKKAIDIEGYAVKQITRLNDLSFSVELFNEKTGKNCKAKIVFSQNKTGKFGIKYKVTSE